MCLESDLLCICDPHLSQVTRSVLDTTLGSGLRMAFTTGGGTVLKTGGGIVLTVATGLLVSSTVAMPSELATGWFGLPTVFLHMNQNASGSFLEDLIIR